QLPGLTAWVCCRRPGTCSKSRGERASRVRCGAEESNSWLPQFENPLAGSMADPGYWKQQYYLASELKQFLPPNRKTITAMQLAPEDIKYVGYLAPDKEKSPNKLTEYVILGPVSDVLKYEFKNQCEVYAVNPSFRQWQKDVDKVIPRKDVHIAVVAAGTAKRLGKKILIQGLAQVSAALTAEGRALLVCDAQDEEVLGGKMEELLEAQEWKDLEKTGDLPPDPEKTAALEVLQQGRLRPPATLLKLVVSDLPDIRSILICCSAAQAEVAGILGNQTFPNNSCSAKTTTKTRLVRLEESGFTIA
ncbi:unnamed protein product, partial [Symbiodinium necroappetens]